MRGIDLPERTEDFTADPVELFFDLAFVFAFAQLVSHLVHHPTWDGFGEFALLFAMVWLPWTQFTWAANAVSGNSRRVRAIFLVATMVSVPMAASVQSAFDDGAVLFAVSAGAILLMGLGLLATSLTPGTPEFRSAVQYSIPNLVAVVVFVIGALVDDEARIALWIVGLLIVVAGTLFAVDGEWIIRSGHFAERHGLILIVALGEVIVAVGLPVVDALTEGEGLDGLTTLGLVASGLFAGLLWWGYFDRPGPALEHYAESLSGVAAGRFARDAYTYAHTPIVAGVIVSAAALEEITLHPGDALHDEFRLMLFAGLGLFALGITVSILRAFKVWAKERIAALAAIGVLLAISGSWDAVWLLVAIDAVILASLAVEHHRIERAQATPVTG